MKAHPDVVKILLEAGADAKKKQDGADCSATDLASASIVLGHESEGQKKCLELLDVSLYKKKYHIFDIQEVKTASGPAA